MPETLNLFFVSPFFFFSPPPFLQTDTGISDSSSLPDPSKTGFAATQGDFGSIILLSDYRDKLPFPIPFPKRFLVESYLYLRTHEAEAGRCKPR